MSGANHAMRLYGLLSNGPFRRSIVNEAAAASPVQPIVNMGQGFLYGEYVG